MLDSDLELRDIAPLHREHRNEDDVNELSKVLLPRESTSGDCDSPETCASRSTRWTAFRRVMKLSPWHLVFHSATLAGLLVLAANLVTLIVFVATSSTEGDAMPIYTGDCTVSSNIVTAIHLGINVLSTVLLAASNFSMQCLGSPYDSRVFVDLANIETAQRTRAEVDHAHSRKQWVSIGVPTLRNLQFVSWTKATLWLMLALSSFPLHMLWNSAVFQTLVTNEYVVITASADFTKGTAWSSKLVPANLTDIVERLQSSAVNSQLERLANDDCMRTYGKQFLSEYSNLILVVDYHNTSSSVMALENIEHFDSYSQWGYGLGLGDPHGLQTYWYSDDDTDHSRYWSISYAKVEYCLGERTAPRCKASIVPWFGVVVITCNALKIIAFVWTIRLSRQNAPLLTVGDAVASSIARPDPATKRRYLVEKTDYQTLFEQSREWSDRPSGVGDIWVGGKWHWGKAVPATYWTIFYLMCAAGLTLVGPAAGGALPSLTDSGTVGLGVGAGSFIAEKTNLSLLAAFLLANLPQILATYAYVALNNMMTNMLAMREWTRFGTGKAKGLRVTALINVAPTSFHYRSDGPDQRLLCSLRFTGCSLS